MKSYGDIDSKFRFVIIAAKRAKQLLRGAKPKLKSKSKNPIRIALNEVAQNLIDYEIIESKKEEISKPEEQVFIGEELMEEGEEKEEKAVGLKSKKEVEHELEEEIDENAKEDVTEKEK